MKSVAFAVSIMLRTINSSLIKAINKTVELLLLMRIIFSVLFAYGRSTFNNGNELSFIDIQRKICNNN